MNRLWTGALATALGCSLAVAAAEPHWQPVPRPTTPAPTSAASVTLGRPLAAPTANFASAAAVSLGRPTAQGGTIALASFTTPTAPRQPLVRGKAGESVFAADIQPRSRPNIQTFSALPPGPPLPADVQGVVPPPPVSSTISSIPECDDDCCNDLWCDEGCVKPRHCYISAEYLLWSIKDGVAPALITTGPAALPPAQQGVIGVPGTAVLANGTLDHEMFSGGRFTLGWWFDPCKQCAVEGRFFFLGRRSAQQFADGNSFPVVARPFFAQNFNIEAAELASSPTINLGRVDVIAPSQLWGAELNLRKNCVENCWARWDVFTGFRYIGLKEGLTVGETITTLGNIGTLAPLVPGSQVFVYDSFQTRNDFYGGQIGTEVEFRAGSWFTNLRGSIAFGQVRQTVTVAGSQNVVPPVGPSQQFVGGLLALPSNIGEYSRNRFAVAPEVGLNVGYQFTEHCRAFVGYNFLYISNVVRPGDQVDRVLDLNQIPNTLGPFPPVAGRSRPLMPFQSSDFWAHGVNFGLECRW